MRRSAANSRRAAASNRTPPTGAYKQRYPTMRVVTPKGAVQRVSEVVAVDVTYDDFPAGARSDLKLRPGRTRAKACRTYAAVLPR